MAETIKIPQQSTRLIDDNGLMSRPWYQFFTRFITKGFINPLYINSYARIRANGSYLYLEVYDQINNEWVTVVTFYPE